MTVYFTLKVNFWPEPNLPNDAHTALLTLEPFHSSVALFLYWGFKKTSKSRKMWKCQSLKRTSASYKLVLVSAYNPVQDVLRKMKKLESTKNLILAFTYFLSASSKNLFQQRRLHKALYPFSFEILIIFFDFLRCLVLSRSATRTVICKLLFL